MSQLREDVLDRTDIVDLVSKYVQLKKVGKNRVGLCPFHKEKSPSFTVAEDKQIFKCFGCGKGGNAITFHMEIEKVDFLDTLKILAEQAHLDFKNYDFNTQDISKSQEEKEKFKLLNKRVQSFFQQHFPGSAAEEYSTKQRKLTEQTISTFGIGYAPDSHYDIGKVLTEKGFTNQDLIKAGVAKQGSTGDTYAFFRHRLTFPIHDHIGNVVGFGGRALDKDQQPKYLNTTETPLYDKSKILFGLNHAREHLRDWSCLVVVEGYMDVIALHQYGIPIGIATCGTALTTQHSKLIKRHTDHLYFAFDNDKAGFDAIIRGLKVAYQHDLFPKVFQFPQEYKDVDEYVTQTQATLDQTKLQEQSSDGFYYVMQTLTQRLDLMSPIDRKKLLNISFDILQHIEDYSILTLYIEQLSELTHIGSQSIFKQFKGFLKQQRKTTYRATQEEQQTSPMQNVHPKYLLATLRYKQFLAQQEIEQHNLIQPYVELIEQVSRHFPESLIISIRQQQASEEDQQLLLEAQMRWENQIGELSKDKKVATLSAFLKQQLHGLSRVVLKSKTIDSQEKQNILQKLRART